MFTNKTNIESQLYFNTKKKSETYPCFISIFDEFNPLG